MYLLFLLLVFYIGYRVGADQATTRLRNKFESLSSPQIKATIQRFLRDYLAKNSTKEASAVVEKQSEFLNLWDQDETYPAQPSTVLTQQILNVKSEQQQPNAVASETANTASVLSKPVDNTALLLYFGAFLFITSMGLFVGFSDVNGTVKTVSIAAVSLLLYSGGLKLYKKSKRFRDVGAAFTGIGMAVAPLIGLGAYNYIFDQSNTAVVWFATSFIVFSLYLHALFTLRNTIVSYLLICSFVSLFESAVSVINAPLYYFAWGLAICGMTLQLITYATKNWQALKDSSFNSSIALIIANLGISTLLISTQGIGQLCVSLGISTLYSFVELYGKRFTQASAFISTQILALLTIATTSFYAFESILGVALIMTLVAGLETLMFVHFRHTKTAPIKQFTTTAVVAACVTSVLSLGNGQALLLSLGSILMLGGAAAYFQRRKDMFFLASAVWVTIPIVYGQMVAATSLQANTQALLACLSLLPNSWFLIYSTRKKLHGSWVSAAETILVLGMGTSIMISLFGDARLVLVVTTTLCSLAGIIAQQTRLTNWPTISGLFPIFAIVASGLHTSSQDIFFAATVVAFLANTALSMLYKEVPTRWFATMTCLMLPVAFGAAQIPTAWTHTVYAWAYVGVLGILVLFRSVARGRLIPVHWATIESLSAKASAAYVYGAVIAGVIASILSYTSTEVALQSTLIVGVVSLAYILLFYYVEKLPEAGLIPPVALQLILVNALQIYNRPQYTSTYLAISLSLALTGYAFRITDKLSIFLDSLTKSSLVMLYLPVLTVILFALPISPLHPLSLILAGICTLHYTWSSSQSRREFAGLVVLAGIFWAMHYSGTRNIQAYSHMLALLFVLYAYWRHRQKDNDTKQQYIYGALITTTIPLAVQALSTEYGGFYGIWLLIEMVGIMIVGISLQEKGATRWGLYVSVASVLYQLRDLGWAMLAVLALFVIGVAIYRTNKEDKS